MQSVREVQVGKFLKLTKTLKKNCTKTSLQQVTGSDGFNSSGGLTESTNNSVRRLTLSNIWAGKTRKSKTIPKGPTNLYSKAFSIWIKQITRWLSLGLRY